MRRRDFVTGLAVSVAWPLVPHAQQAERLRRVVVLPGANIPEAQNKVAALRRGLENLGWIDDRNLRLDVHWWAPNPDRMQQDLAEIIARKPEVIVTGTSVAIAQTLRTSSIPIVFASITDPVGQGFVKSLAKPGATPQALPLTRYRSAASGRDAQGGIAQLGSGRSFVRAVDSALHGRHCPFHRCCRPIVRHRGDGYAGSQHRRIGKCHLNFGRLPNSGLIVPPAHFTLTNFELVNVLAAKHRLPAIYAIRSVVVAGGLISYGVDGTDQFTPRRPGT